MLKSVWIALAAAMLSFGAETKAIALISDPALPRPAEYGLAQLQQALTAKGFQVSRLATTSATTTILAGLSNTGGAAAKALQAAGVALPHDPESLVIRRTKAGLVLCGADARGLMYAALDTAEQFPAVHE